MESCNPQNNLDMNKKEVIKLQNNIAMIEKQCLINSKVLDTLMNIVSEENLPINIKVGNRHKRDDGSTLIDVLYEYDYKDANVINETLCRAVNLTFGLVDD